MIRLTNAIFITEQEFTNDRGTSYRYKLACDQGELQFYTREKIAFPMNRFDMAAKATFSLNNFKLSVTLSDIEVKA